MECVRHAGWLRAAGGGQVVCFVAARLLAFLAGWVRVFLGGSQVRRSATVVPMAAASLLKKSAKKAAGSPP